MITREADYAIRSLLLLSEFKQSDKLATTLSISEDIEVPYRFLRKILLRLKDAGFVKTKKGKNGGLILAKQESEISVYDILQAISQTSLAFSLCTGTGKKECHRKGFCNTHSHFEKIQIILDNELKKLTLAKLAAK